ncbi:MAG TPA: tetratricopeptide repeat protein [Alphaproteobacteria bacterium]|nr:tetratricopeptide repeat protein [Alphaproteobacteria bacterium]
MFVMTLLNLLFLVVWGGSVAYAHHGAPHDYFTAGQDPGAQQYLSLVETAHTNKAVDWMRKGRLGDAIADLKYTLERFPNHPKGLLLMGVVGGLSSNPALALPYYERALRLFPQYALTHAQYGAYLVELGRTDAGIAKLQHAVEMNPRSAPAYGWLAKAYAKAGKRELAQQAAARARELGFRGDPLGRLQRHPAK